ncbi:MAG: SH3 domain-containing protein [Clostridiales bacterium]|nr:SH3 domain-containing protein [Clostridiales bacterium]
MNRIKKFLSILISVLAAFSLTFSAAAYSLDDVVYEAMEIIISMEGTYNTVLPNDNGALSIGRMGWHGTRALDLLQEIAAANPTQAQNILGSALYNEITTASNWNSRTLTASEAAVISELLATDESKEVQDEFAYSDVKDYIIHGQSLGFEDAGVLVFLADVENQCGASVADRVAQSAIEDAGSASGVTLDIIYNAALGDKTAGSSSTRRKTIYEYCKSISSAVASDESEYAEGQYVTTAESGLRIRTGAGFSNSFTGTLIPEGTTVTVTEVSGSWGKVTYNGVTGWIYLEYANYKGSTPTASSPSVGFLSTASGVKGDADGNGTVTAADARLVLRAAASLENVSDSVVTLCDINGNGKLDPSDARAVLRIAAGLVSI